MKRRALAHTKNPPRDDWCTPKVVADLVYRFFDGPVGLDPAANTKQLIVAKRYNFKVASPVAGVEALCGDGLDLDWYRHRTVFFNPPYGRGINGAWARKAHREAVSGAEIIGLVPSCPGAKWWDYYWVADRVCFWRGRLRFVGAPHVADFESAIVYFGSRGERFREIFGPHGRVVFDDLGPDR